MELHEFIYSTLNSSTQSYIGIEYQIDELITESNKLYKDKQ